MNIPAKIKLDPIKVDTIKDKNKTFWVYFSQGIGLYEGRYERNPNFFNFIEFC